MPIIPAHNSHHNVAQSRCFNYSIDLGEQGLPDVDNPFRRLSCLASSAIVFYLQPFSGLAL